VRTKIPFLPLIRLLRDKTASARRASLLREVTEWNQARFDRRLPFLTLLFAAAYFRCGVFRCSLAQLFLHVVVVRYAARQKRPNVITCLNGLYAIGGDWDIAASGLSTPQRRRIWRANQNLSVFYLTVGFPSTLNHILVRLLSDLKQLYHAMILDNGLINSSVTCFLYLIR